MVGYRSSNSNKSKIYLKTQKAFKLSFQILHNNKENGLILLNQKHLKMSSQHTGQPQVKGLQLQIIILQIYWEI